MKQAQTVTMLLFAIIIGSCSDMDDEQKQLINVNLKNQIVANIVTENAAAYGNSIIMPAVSTVTKAWQSKRAEQIKVANFVMGSSLRSSLLYNSLISNATKNEDQCLSNIKKACDEIPPFVQSLNAELANDLAKTQENLNAISEWQDGNKILSAEDSTRFADTAPYSYLMAYSNLNDSIFSEMIKKCENDSQLWKDIFSDIAISGKKSKIYGLQYRIMTQYYLAAIKESDIKVDYIAPYKTENDKAETYEIGFSNKQAFLGTFHKENDKWVLNTEDWKYDVTLIGMGID